MQVGFAGLVCPVFRCWPSILPVGDYSARPAAAPEAHAH